MSSKVIAWTFFTFLVLVVINYLFIVAGNLFSGGILIHADQPSFGLFFNSGTGLSSIDFSLFDKGGSGRSYITQGYGRTLYSSVYPGNWHDGIDIAASYGAPIYSPAEGTVLATGNQDNYCFHRGFGKYVAVEDATNHLILWFAHLGTISVAPGQTVHGGTLVGSVGNTGFETGTHLHFSIFRAAGFSMPARNGCGPEPTGEDVNPLNYLGTVYK